MLLIVEPIQFTRYYTRSIISSSRQSSIPPYPSLTSQHARFFTRPSILQYFIVFFFSSRIFKKISFFSLLRFPWILWDFPKSIIENHESFVRRKYPELYYKSSWWHSGSVLTYDNKGISLTVLHSVSRRVVDKNPFRGQLNTIPCLVIVVRWTCFTQSCKSTSTTVFSIVSSRTNDEIIIRLFYSFALELSKFKIRTRRGHRQQRTDDKIIRLLYICIWIF